MKNILLATAALALSAPLTAQEPAALAPGEIVAQAKAEEWIEIPAEQLLVMTLAPDAEGNARQVVIQLMPPPFSQGWIDNIRLFARSGWYDGISVNRVQDNYVVQWGDPKYDNPEATGEAKTLPEGLKVVGEHEYTVSTDAIAAIYVRGAEPPPSAAEASAMVSTFRQVSSRDAYTTWTAANYGWPLASSDNQWWPVHCYGMIGVGRNLSPDTGSGAELYTVIGHAPRHLDRNIAVVGRVIEGMEHLSSLPRGKGALGFYGPDEVAKRTPILTVRVASDLAAAPASSSEAVGQQTQPKFEYLSTEGETFARYAEARANRRDPFFNVPAGGADICNIPVPVRRAAE